MRQVLTSTATYVLHLRTRNTYIDVHARTLTLWLIHKGEQTVPTLSGADGKNDKYAGCCAPSKWSWLRGFTHGSELIQKDAEPS